MKLRKNKKPSFAPQKQKLSLKYKLEWVCIILTLYKPIVELIKYIVSKF